MSMFELNKIAGALLATVLFVMGLGVVAGIIFDDSPPEVAGFLIELPDDDAVAEVEAEPVEEVPLGVLLASADVSAGESAVRVCAACHTFEQGGANRVGPNLWDVVTGPKGHIAEFSYSSSLQERADAGEVWGFEELYLFLENPRGYLPGTSMAFAGVRDQQDRVNIIAYMRSLSDNPPPLPPTE